MVIFNYIYSFKIIKLINFHSVDEQLKSELGVSNSALISGF